MKHTFIATTALVVVLGIVVNEAYAAPFEQDIVVKPSNPHTDERVTITCFNEPAHPAGVNGILEVEDPTGNSYAIGSTFKVGDFNNNGIPDNYLTVTFPDDFDARVIHGKYMVFCQFWSGECECVEPGEMDVMNKAFWQFFYVSFNVLPESSMGVIGLIGSSALAGWLFYSKYLR
ncbi:MAG: hypothetical protein QXM92_02095 [Candidatus Anstonellales archaeon]